MLANASLLLHTSQLNWDRCPCAVRYRRLDSFGVYGIVCLSRTWKRLASELAPSSDASRSRPHFFVRTNCRTCTVWRFIRLSLQMRTSWLFLSHQCAQSPTLICAYSPIAEGRHPMSAWWTCIFDTAYTPIDLGQMPLCCALFAPQFITWSVWSSRAKLPWLMESC